MSKYPPVEYQNYLGLDQLLGSQKPKSDEYGSPAHDEMLFIIVHQAYELWFKQILTEIDSILEIFKRKTVEDTDMGVVVSRLQRIVEIQTVLVQQINVMETMTPLDFLEFRDFLYPASGFQSVQNRLIENKLGLKISNRLQFNKTAYTQFIDEKYRTQVETSHSEPSLYDLVEQWLERTPFVSFAGFDFWKEYKDAAMGMLEKDRDFVLGNTMLNPEERQKNLAEIDSHIETFNALFDKDQYQKLREEGSWRMSYKALHAALFINIYRDQPALQLPFTLLSTLLDIDENFTTWRYRHALMAHRMLGRKIGTGGSSGHQYLKQATDKHKIFNDLFNLTTYFIPRSQRPVLPEKLQKQLSLNYSMGV